jgi:hypothetical protein
MGNTTVDHVLYKNTDEAVLWALADVVIVDVFNATYRAVDNSEHWAVNGAVYEAVDDQGHPALQDFLRSARRV